MLKIKLSSSSMLLYNKNDRLLFKFIFKSFKNYSSTKSNLSILFYGSDRFSLPTLKCLHSNLNLLDNDQNKLIKSLDICTKV